MATISFDSNDLAEMRKAIETFKGAPIVIIRSTNDVLSGVKTQSAKLIGLKVTATAKNIKKTFKVKKMFKADMRANVECTSEPLPLVQYSATQVKKTWGSNAGASVKVLKAGKKKVIPHAFIATMKSGHKGVFWRTKLYNQAFNPKRSYGHFKEIYGDYKNPFRYIHELYGPPISEIYDDPDIINPTLADANKRLQDRLDYHTKRLIDKAR